MLLLATAVSCVGQYNYDVVNANTSWMASHSHADRVVLQRAVLGPGSPKYLYLAARDRLYQLDDELSLVRSVSLVPACRRNKHHLQLVTRCSLHNDAQILAVLSHDASRMSS